MLQELLLLTILIPIGVISLYTGVYKLLSHRVRKRNKKDIYPTLSLIIALYNEEKVLKLKITNTINIDYPKDKIEIIFLNDRSTDKSFDIIKKEAPKLPYNWRIINNLGGKGKPGALNYILPKLKKEIVIITDADSLIERDAIIKLVQNFQDKEIGGVNGRISVTKPSENQREYKKEKEYRNFFDIWRIGESKIHSITICNGPLMAFRRSLIKNAQLTTKSGCSADDTELALYVIKKGFRVIYDPMAIVYEITPTDPQERRKQKMRRAFGIIHSYLRNLDLFLIPKFNINFFFSFFIMIISPILVVFNLVTYLTLIFYHPSYIFLLGVFFIPKFGPILREFYSTQLLISVSPALSKGWVTAQSSRGELSKK